MYGGNDGGASQFAGGGFMPSPAGAGGTVVSPTQRKGEKRNESLTPLTVRQLHEGLNGVGLDDTIRVDGEDINNLTLVGKIVGEQESSTSINYKIDDGTGQVDVRYWLEDSDADAPKEFSMGDYVRVFGHLRSFQNQRNIVAFSMRPVKDYNEVTFHFVEVVYVHLHNTKGQGATPGSVKHETPKAPPANYMNSSATADTDMGNTSGLANDCQEAVSKIFNSPQAQQNDQGIPIDQVVQELGRKYSAEQIKNAVEFMVNEGHLYSTIDDQHFKSTAF
ncbi:hypothetical protein CYMTET_48805 [Cymbomonas tetramitiformis]|uniref:Replication protein A C-terminal domain-containing protein n=1 Tax=Cymbomonas tetramitiformis TaxID=36881 RepID=A0AAE0EUS3_9CHLO|nr:hypothetical protein CYMTET_48805 [Cymbomonas tetramitiformis]